MTTLILILLALLQNLVLTIRLESVASLSEKDRYSAKAGMVSLVVCLMLLVGQMVSLLAQ